MAKAEDLSARFCSYVEDSQIKGINYRGEEAAYVSRDSLERYWTTERIRDVLLSCEPHLTEDAASIQKRFPLIFSILVYISAPSAISYFARRDWDDHHLPMSPADLNRRHWAEAFLEIQWMFRPLEFSDRAIDRRELQTDRILPLKYTRQISEDGRDQDAARIWEAKIHGGYKNLIPEAAHRLTEQDGRAALKVYESDSAEGLYNAEAYTYAMLSNRFENITRLYGSFSFKGTQSRMLVLEYAPGGSLVDFFQNTQPPVTPEDFNLLWDRLLELTDGLHALHNLSAPELSSSGSIVGWVLFGEVPSAINHCGRIHLDIKPSNILVFPQSDKSRFDVRFKLADFGITEMKRVSRTNPDMAIKNGGSRMYSPPECYTNSSAQAISRSPVNIRSDIWALGAVYSEVLVWSLAGEKGREDYRSERKREISQHTNLLGSGFDACFHDGIRRLDQVEKSHLQALERKRQTDARSPRMSDFILHYMLTDRDARLEAKQLQLHAPPRAIYLDEPSLPRTQPLRETRQRQTWSEGSGLRDVLSSPRGLLHPPPSSSPVPPQLRPPLLTELPGRGVFSAPQLNTHARMSSLPYLSESPPDEAGLERLDLPEHPPSQREESRASGATAPFPQEDLVTVGMVYPILKEKNKSITRAIRLKIQGKESDVMGLAGMEDARSKIKACGGREQIMLVDNFSSMKPHMDKVCKTARVISYVAKVADDNEMDLYFASDPTTPLKCSSSTAIESAIRKMKTVEGKCNMRNCLNDILKQAWGDGVGAVNSTSIYVYTDGVWEPGEDHVDHVIKRAIGQLVEAKEPSSTLMIQFIQFGRDETGSARLRYLDDKCTEVHDPEEYDIVDTKHSDDHVPDIVIGSISRFTDDKKPSASGPGS
ncbi:hypothetical protein ACJZ2D_013731 [Fusarium nematophilum]